jgi:hypothetical protein
MRMIRPFLVATFLALWSLPAVAQSDMPQIEDIVQVRLIQGWQQEDGSLIAAVQVDLADGWKTYWRVAGETGLPPVFDWQKSGNLADIKYLWPRPSIIELDGMVILGYSHQLILPIQMTPVTAGAEIQARASLDLGVCREVCIPVRAELTFNFDTSEGAEADIIKTAVASQPGTATIAGVTSITCELALIDGGYHLTARIEFPGLPGPREIVIVEPGNPEVWVGNANSQRDGNTLVSEMDLLIYSAEPTQLDPAKFRVSVIGDTSSVDISGCPVKS